MTNQQSVLELCVATCATVYVVALVGALFAVLFVLTVVFVPFVQAAPASSNPKMENIVSKRFIRFG
jgi:hypothetical protein